MASQFPGSPKLLKGALAVYAFTSGCELGIDVERLRPVLGMDDIAARFFCPEEIADLTALSPAEKPQGFFNCWARKEAYIKAIGDGLSVPLDSFRVSLQPGAPAQLLHLDRSPVAAQGWTLHHFIPAQDHTGALAYHDRARPLRRHAIMAAGELLDCLQTA